MIEKFIKTKLTLPVGTICGLVFLLSHVEVNAQSTTPIFENFSSELPSDEVHNMFQDSLGYVWLATDNGITKYDGRNFRQIETDAYLLTPVVFNFFVESSTKVWLSTKRNRLYWFNPLELEPIFHPYKFNSKLEKSLNVKLGTKYIRKIHFDKDNTLKLTFLNASGYLAVDSSGTINVNKYFDSYYFRTNTDAFINLFNDFVFNELTKGRKKNKSGLSFVHENGKDTVLIFDDKKLYFYTGISDYKYANNNCFVLINDFLLKISDDSVITYALPSVGLTLYIDNSRVLVGAMSGVLELDHDLKLKSSFLKRNSISSIIKDNQNGFWFSTLQKGIFRTDNIDTKIIELSNHVNFDYLSIKNHSLVVIDKINRAIWKLQLDNSRIDSIGSVSFSSTHALVSLDNKRVFDFFKESANIKVYSPNKYNIDSNNSQIVLHRNSPFPKVMPTFGSFYFLEGTTYRQFSPKIEYPDGYFTSYFYFDSIILFGRVNGLYQFDLANQSFSEKPILNSKNISISQIVKYQQSILLISEKGLYAYHGDSISPIFKGNKAPFNKLNGIHIANDSLAWIYGIDGIFKILKRGNSFQFSQLDQIPKEEVISMAFYDGQLFVGGREKLYAFDSYNSFEKTKLDSTSFIIDSVIINNINFLSDKNLNLSYNDELIIFFKIVAFGDLSRHNFEYSFNSSRWLETNKNNLTINNVPYGNFSLKIRAKQHPEVILYEYNSAIPTPIIKQIWFQILVVIFIIVAIYFLIRHSIKLQIRRKETKLKKVSTELKLLISQMNPHFTFNSIHSIQYYIINNNKDKAIEYLSDFALLIRKTLDFSMHEFITIKEEIEFLKLYISLENKRLEFDYFIDFKLSDELNLDQKIPALLLQPLIENIVQHASYKPTDEKKIIIDIKYKSGFFYIKVIDFGNSINKEEGLKDHKSYGLSILRNRINIYNGKVFKESQLKIIPTDSETKQGKTVLIKIKEWM